MLIKLQREREELWRKNINWNNTDGGGDFWLYLPSEAEADAAVFLSKEQTSAYLIEIEDRYTSFDSNNSTNTDEDTTSYVRFSNWP